MIRSMTRNIYIYISVYLEAIAGSRRAYNLPCFLVPICPRVQLAFPGSLSGDRTCKILPSVGHLIETRRSLFKG